MTHPFDKDYWEQVWKGERGTTMASGPPNPHLVSEIGGVAPGTALDAGCGAGVEAIWLARKGWQVTAVDIASDALARAQAHAAADGVGGQVHWVTADLSRWEPDIRYDLVATHYAHPAMPQLEFYDRIASWVAPSGTLFIVGHLDHANPHAAAEPTGGHCHGNGHAENMPPAAASATATSITERLAPTLWDVVTARESHRAVTGPDGETILHDVVVTAIRRP
jgi:SAM-dependent methyltransferase